MVFLCCSNCDRLFQSAPAATPSFTPNQPPGGSYVCLESGSPHAWVCPVLRGKPGTPPCANHGFMVQYVSSRMESCNVYSRPRSSGTASLQDCKCPRTDLCIDQVA